VRYSLGMNLSVPLSPHLEQFLREQLASGSFRTEGDVILAALKLLEDQSHAAFSADFGHNPLNSPTKSGSTDDERLAGEIEPQSVQGRHRARGLLADIASHLSPDDFKDARHEMWSSFPHDDAR
jgi:putative addiction module CopG family antidote